MVKKLIGNKVSLAPLTKECIQEWTKWLNDMEVSLPLGGEVYENINLMNQEESLNSMQKRDKVAYSIIENKENINIGRILLFGVDHINDNAVLGLFIGEKEFWNNGYGEDAIRLILDYAFCILNLHNVSLGVYAFNTRALKCYKKIGFKEIGRRREFRKINNKRYDSVLMDLLNSEYKPKYLNTIINSITGENK